MDNLISTLYVTTSSQGLREITREVNAALSKHNISEGLCTLFIRHTSASLIIQENADTSARLDLEQWLNRLVVENDPIYTHTYEGDDDMPAHIKSALTSVSLSIPFSGNQLMLGTWQGVFLWEHRHQGGSREIILHVTS